MSDSNIGGAGVLLLNKIKNINKKIFDVTVILPHNSALYERLKNENVKILMIDGCKDKSFDLKSLIDYIKAIKNISPHIVNSHSCMNSRIAGRILGVRVNVYTRHCDFNVSRIFANYLVRSAVRLFDNLISDGVIAVSHSARENLLKLGIEKNKIKIIINGAQPIEKISRYEKRELRALLGIPDKATVISIFSRLEPYKDHDTFLRAASLLKKSKYYFLVVGAGSREVELKRLAKKLNIENKIRFCGFLNNVAPLMNITDINVNCSIGTETSSLALSEGMSIGVPAIASDYAGNKYMVKNGVNGLIFKQGDYRELARKIYALENDKALYNKLSQNALKRFERELNASRMTKETERYYISLLKRNANNKKRAFKAHKRRKAKK